MMQKVRLGKSGMQVTKVGFGGIPIQRLSEDQAVRVVAGALELGIDWLDTAHGYGFSEEVIGRALRRFDRSNFKIFTKGPGRTPEELRSQIDLSLQRAFETRRDQGKSPG